MKCQSLFYYKRNKKNISLLSADLVKRVVKVNLSKANEIFQKENDQVFFTYLTRQNLNPCCIPFERHVCIKLGFNQDPVTCFRH